MLCGLTPWARNIRLLARLSFSAVSASNSALIRSSIVESKKYPIGTPNKSASAARRRADGLSRRPDRRCEMWTPETVTPRCSSACAAESLEYSPLLSRSRHGGEEMVELLGQARDAVASHAAVPPCRDACQPGDRRDSSIP